MKLDLTVSKIMKLAQNNHEFACMALEMLLEQPNAEEQDLIAKEACQKYPNDIVGVVKEIRNKLDISLAEAKALADKHFIKS